MQRLIFTLTGLWCILALAIAPTAHAQTTSTYSFEVRGGGYTPGGDSNEIAIYKGSTLLGSYDLGLKTPVYNSAGVGVIGPIVTWGNAWSNSPTEVVNFALTYNQTTHIGTFSVSGFYGPDSSNPTLLPTSYTTSFTTPNNFVFTGMTYAAQANKLSALDGDAVNFNIQGIGNISTTDALVGPVSGSLSYINNILKYTGTIAFINQCDWHQNDITKQMATLVLTGNTISPVPLPGAIWLLGSGIVGLVGYRRRIRNA